MGENLEIQFDQILLFIFRNDLLTSREKMKRQNSEYRLHMVTMVDRLVKTEKELDRVMMLEG